MDSKSKDIKVQNQQNVQSASKIIKNLADEHKKQQESLEFVKNAHLSKDAIKPLLSKNTFVYDLTAYATQMTYTSNKEPISWKQIKYLASHQYLLVSKTMKDDTKYFVMVKVPKKLKRSLRYCLQSSKDKGSLVPKNNNPFPRNQYDTFYYLHALNLNWRYTLKKFCNQNVFSRFVSKIFPDRYLNTDIPNDLKSTVEVADNIRLENTLYDLCIDNKIIFRLNYICGSQLCFVRGLDDRFGTDLNSSKDLNLSFIDVKNLISSGLIYISKITNLKNSPMFYIYPTSDCRKLISKYIFPDYPYDRKYRHGNKADDIAFTAIKMHLKSIKIGNLRKMMY